ncbi:MAG TPA: hypothetical protein VFH61_00615 [Thermoleophilia bacterium]|nr:hypothetical protein [Thermoleophilia bacterium]
MQSHLMTLLAQTSSTSTTPPGSVSEVLNTGTGLLDAIQAKNWPLAVGLGLMMLIWGLKTTGVLEKIKLGSKLGIRMSAVILSVLAAVGAGLIQGLPAMEIVLNTFEIATAAVGSWELIGKLLRKKPKAEAEAEAAPS